MQRRAHVSSTPPCCTHMNSLVESALFVVPLACIARLAYRRMQTRSYGRLAAEACFGIVLLNVMSALANAMTTASRNVQEWNDQLSITCPQQSILGSVIQQQCQTAKDGMKRTWVGLWFTHLGDVGWLVVLFRVDLIGAFNAVSNSHVGAWATAMILVLIVARTLVFAFGPENRWPRKSRSRLARPKIVTATPTTPLLSCIPDPINPDKLNCKTMTSGHLILEKNVNTDTTGPSVSVANGDLTRDEADLYEYSESDE